MLFPKCILDLEISAQQSFVLGTSELKNIKPKLICKLVNIPDLVRDWLADLVSGKTDIVKMSDNLLRFYYVLS